MSTLFIVIPAYNEAENIRSCVADWYPVIERHAGGGKSRLVVIDDGSKDATFSILQELEQDHPLLTALTKPNGGHGATVLFGYRYAVTHGADFIFQTDSDGQTNPDEFESFWALRMQYDAVIGNRVVRGDGKQRKFVENTVCFLLRLIFGIRVEDANAPFRLMKAALVERYLSRLPEDFNLPNIMLTAYFVYYREAVCFLPITFQPRAHGVNSINFRKIIRIGWHAMWDFLKLRAAMR